jgi:hypothetical protein
MNSKLMTRKSNRYGLLVVCASLLLSGCANENLGDLADYPSNPVRPMPAIDPPIAEAGVKVDIKPDEQFARTKLVASNRNFGNRRDAFALLPAEANFERSQRQEFVFQESGGFFGQEYELPEEPTAPTIVVEPQPLNRRMSGVLLGNGVSALLEMENGQTYEVFPGAQIPGSPWYVVSIDGSKLVLGRDGDVLPKTVVVVLGPKLTGGGGGGNSGSDSGSGAGGGREGRGRGTEEGGRDGR